MDLREGDILICKKPHPCGGNRFALLRAGMDLRVRCLGCGHEIWVRRSKLEPNIRLVERSDGGQK